jgi:putative ABC transport system substrate-binding protein
MKKVFISFLVVLSFVGLFWFVKNRNSGPQKPVIAVLKIASHPAIDAACDGFCEAFTAGLGNRYAFVVKNADGSVANAQTIAQGLTSRSDVVAFAAFGTPAAQALVQKESVRPIFVTAVTYPEKSGIVQNNVAGISDYFNLKDLVIFAHKLVPGASQIGILYNPGSEVACEEMNEIEDACRSKGLTPIRIAGVTEADILGALKSNLRKIDLCVAPTDNTIASVMSALASMCKNAQVPMIVADKTLVASGPAAGLGMDYYQLGFDLGVAATRVFLGECTAAEIGFVRAEPSFALNQPVIKELSSVVAFDKDFSRE